MSNFFTPPKTYRPRRVILSEDQNADNAAIKAAFDELGESPLPGQQGVSTPFAVGTATEPYHAVTKQTLDASPASATAAATSAAEALASELAAAASELAASTSAIATINRVEVSNSDYTVPASGGSYEIFVESLGTASTITLPLAPVDGQMVEVSDFSFTSFDYNITIDRNGATIHDVAEDLIIDVSGSTVVLVHFTGNWIIKGVPL